MLGWHEMVANIADNLAKGHCSRAAAEAEHLSLQALAAAPDKRDIGRRISETFYAEPVVRHHLGQLASSRTSDISELPDRETGFAPASRSFDPSPENLSIWLNQPAVHAPAARQPEEERHKPITAADISLLRDRIAGSWDPVDIIFADDIQFSRMADLAAAVMAEAIWATGARPSEWPTAKLHVGKFGSVEDLHLSLLRRESLPLSHLREAFLRRVKGDLYGVLESGPVRVHIESAKTAWTMRYGLPTTRKIGLSLYPLSVQTSVYCATILASRAAATTRRGWTNWQDRINRRLQRLAPEIRRDALTLYSFRHDFIERCKASMPPEEVAALAGHCSASSKASYGRPKVRGGKRAAFPAQPDPAHVGLLREHFARPSPRRGTRAVKALKPEPRPSPAPGFAS